MCILYKNTFLTGKKSKNLMPRSTRKKITNTREIIGWVMNIFYFIFVPTMY